MWHCINFKGQYYNIWNQWNKVLHILNSDGNAVKITTKYGYWQREPFNYCLQMQNSCSKIYRMLINFITLDFVRLVFFFLLILNTNRIKIKIIVGKFYNNIYMYSNVYIYLHNKFFTIILWNSVTDIKNYNTFTFLWFMYRKMSFIGVWHLLKHKTRVVTVFHLDCKMNTLLVL